MNMTNIVKSLLLAVTFSFLTITPKLSFAKNTLERDMSLFTENEKNTISIFKNSVKSVVNVSNIQIARTSWFETQTSEVPIGAGSGFVWDNKGHIVTNFHVAMDADTFMISFHGDKKQYRAKLVGAEPKLDIAVLKLETFPKKIHPIAVGVSDNLLVGQKTLAIGNPFGLDHTITQGIVSALNRKIPGIGDVTIHGMIQTDSSINPGNSGGPLIDSTGKLIGMNTLIYSKSGSSSGVGFAVPVSSIKRTVPQLISHGKVIRPGLGIGILPEMHKVRFGIEKGIVITFLDKKGGAFKAGLEGIKRDQYGRYIIGDTILAVNGKEVNNLDDIYHILNLKKIGDKVKVTYRRGIERKKRKIEVLLIEL
jgi:S1-C subfamily serine protease